MTVASLKDIATLWNEAWPQALEPWSRFTRLKDPVWCISEQDEKREGLAGSFAMIRLQDHQVVISLRQIQQLGLETFPVEVMAHEVGHHVYCPGDLLDEGRMMARIRKAPLTCESFAGTISNIYADLMINNRLQRSEGLKMAAVYKKLGSGGTDKLWTLYMRIYEILWQLPKGSLIPEVSDRVLEGDAQLGSRLARVYARDWLDGSGSFACLCLPYLLQDGAGHTKKIMKNLGCEGGLEGNEVPTGLAEVDPEEESSVHPSMDPRVTGHPAEALPKGDLDGSGKEKIGGQKTQKDYREPREYGDLLRALGFEGTDHDVAVRYYRELALPHLIRFPERIRTLSHDPLPEGFDSWDVGMPLEDIDWFQTLVESPIVIPGTTIRQRVYGVTEGATPDREPLDLYIGIDCSGSMLNPQNGKSYPVIAGTILALSALRAGSRVMVTLSGEPGRTVSTDGFIRDEDLILRVLTDYLGTGTTFGIHRLASTFKDRPSNARPAHILIITDNDIFNMLDSTQAGKLGWTVAEESKDKALGGASYVLNMNNRWGKGNVERMKKSGWNVYMVSSWVEVVSFAKDFSRRKYEQQAKMPARRL